MKRTLAYVQEKQAFIEGVKSKQVPYCRVYEQYDNLLRWVVHILKETELLLLEEEMERVYIPDPKGDE